METTGQKLSKQKKITGGNIMLKNYITIFLRNWKKQPVYSFINVFGLAVGIACCIVIMLYVIDELSYDNFHKKGDRIYRVVPVEGSARSQGPLPEAMHREIPGVENFVRLRSRENLNLVLNEQPFSEAAFFADPSFFDVFTFQIIKGDPKSALDKPENIVLTETLAEKIYGTTDAVGKTISCDSSQLFGYRELVVSAVMKDIPENSHFKFGALLNYKLFEDNVPSSQNWYEWLCYNYILLKDGVPGKEIEESLPQLFAKYAPEATEPYQLQALKDIHLFSGNRRFEIAPQGNGFYVYLMLSIAILVLGIACINFMNLSTARASKRAQEIGVRKVLGSDRKNLIKQFLVESIAMSVTAFIIAVICVITFMPYIREVIGKNIDLNLINNWITIPLLILGAVLVGLISGSYPAFFMSAIKPVKNFKQSSKTKFAGIVRKLLVVLQFAVSVFLIAGTLIINDQLDYIKNKNLGFSKEQIMVLNVGNSLNSKLELTRSELLKNPNIKKVSASLTVPGQNTYNVSFGPEGMPQDEGVVWGTYMVDSAFISLMEMELIDGRNFSFLSDSSAFILNESAAKDAVLKAGDIWKNPIGRTLTYYRSSGNGYYAAKQGPVIGVIKDFHYSSLHTNIEPLVLQLDGRILFNLMIKINPENISETVSFVESKWKELGFQSIRPFNFFFLDENFNIQYQNEEQTAKLVKSFSFIAILIACLGLFGLAAYTAEQRTKEIGIRKAVGASTFNIVNLLTGEFLKLIAFGFLTAAPLIYSMGNEWLSSFAYRISITGRVFIISGTAVFLIAVLTVLFQSIKAALKNPVDVLKTE